MDDRGGRGKHEKKKFDKDNGPAGHGRLGRLSEQTLGYYKRVEQTLTEGFEDKEEKSLFLDNVFKQLSEEALEVSRNQTASRIVEHLVKESSGAQHLIQLGEALSKDWELVSTDRFACYVTQTLAQRLGEHIGKSPTIPAHDDGDFSATASSLMTDLYSFLMSSLPLYMQHTYTSHIIRTMMEALVGVKVSEKVIRSQTSRQSTKDKAEPQHTTVRQVYKQNAKFLTLFEEMCNTILKLPKLEDHARNFLSNPVLQTMLMASKACPGLHEKVCTVLIEKTQMFAAKASDTEDGESSQPPGLVGHSIGSHLVQQVLATASEELFSQILEDHFSGKLVVMAVHPVANFIVQSLIRHAHNKEQFCTIYGELADNLEDILASGHPGVVVSLAEGCLKHSAKQDKLVKALMKAFHCYKPAERQSKVFPLFVSLTTYDVFYRVKELEDSDSDDKDEKEELVQVPTLQDVNLHGSLILQQMLQFGNPKVLVSSLLEMKPAEIKTLACNPCGSHVVDVFMKSASIGEKSRDIMYQRLKNFYMDLACHKTGSRSVDALWEAAAMKNKFVMAEALAAKEARLRSDPFGRFIWHKAALGHFVRRREEWKQIQTGNLKKRKLFQDIIADKDNKKIKKDPKETEKEDSDEAIDMRLQDSDDEGIATKSTVLGVSFPQAPRDTQDQGQGRHDDVSSEDTDRRRTKKKKKKNKRENPRDSSEVGLAQTDGDASSKTCKKKSKKKRE